MSATVASVLHSPHGRPAGATIQPGTIRVTRVPMFSRVSASTAISGGQKRHRFELADQRIAPASLCRPRQIVNMAVYSTAGTEPLMSREQAPACGDRTGCRCWSDHPPEISRAPCVLGEQNFGLDGPVICAVTVPIHGGCWSTSSVTGEWEEFYGEAGMATSYSCARHMAPAIGVHDIRRPATRPNEGNATAPSRATALLESREGNAEARRPDDPAPPGHRCARRRPSDGASWHEP